ncbi:amidohydrolase family protein [Rhizobium laguerreae]|uniref:amidohydrolase family protein n=1 Tax=Rhizobium laguerreae TaxID=1076926 RepID=UPI00103EF215|nr:amidohydrolase [Rhizobium laguerreae]MBY3074191.1 amidohydrolase family protein [Rhizobium laguerreae]MBY3100125.1 amidohydrolase family protein [Rhizobium laguerreae]MBY3250316.1 amidohydrolase family protein [Rhizobium laguerreae]MBY3526889.1 amidohydrolase family protein [Rhizobium laguerreae]MBY3566955.1 amidohydrolase family protein [Rhizobium laguerreae]
MFIDTHLHIIDRSALPYPWLSGVPDLDHDFLYEAYAREARRCGITTVLHMEVDVDPAAIQAETDHVASLAEKEGSLIAGAIVSCRPEEEGFAAYLERQKADPFVKGFRRVLHVVPDDVSEGALFRENIRRISGSSLTFDLCTLPHQASRVTALADLAPDVQFVLDHCGVPDIRSDAFGPWKTGISEIARRPNVVCKVSGVVAYADAKTWTAQTLQPYIEHVTASFGWDRVVWGSDWPVCTLGGGLSTWVAATHSMLSGVSETERSKLLFANAQRLWSL